MTSTTAKRRTKAAVATMSAVAALGSAIWLAPSSTAQADPEANNLAVEAESEWQHYNVWGSNSSDSPTEGDAHAYGNVVWFGKHRFYIDHIVNDICEDDGRWAELHMSVQYMNGKWGEGLRVAADKGGCRSEKKSFGKEFKRKGRIKQISLTATETDGRYGQAGITKFRDNPYTG